MIIIWIIFQINFAQFLNAKLVGKGSEITSSKNTNLKPKPLEVLFTKNLVRLPRCTRRIMKIVMIWAVVVATLVEQQSLPTPEVHRLNP